MLMTIVGKYVNGESCLIYLTFPLIRSVNLSVATASILVSTFKTLYPVAALILTTGFRLLAHAES
jgi:hypothetical protein